MNGVELRVERDAERAASAVAQVLADADGDVALTGGTTPKRAYELAAERRTDWSAVAFWWGDERCVPPDDERSNYRLARETLLDRVERTGPVHRIRGELPAVDAAGEYERELGERALALLLLGVGADGHTASLFPHAPALQEERRRVVAASPGLDPWVERVTLTLPAIASAERVVFLVTGAAKAEAARRSFAEPPGPATPASLARGRETLAVLDRAAASALS